MLSHYLPRTLFTVLLMVFVGGSVDSSAQQDVTQKPPCSGQITYLSDTDSAYRYLEHQQREFYKENPRFTDHFLRAELNNPRAVRTFHELKKRAQQSCPDPKKRDTCALDPDLVDKLLSSLACLNLPTRFEPPLVFALIDLTVKRMSPVLSRFPDAPAARFGSLPTATINAQAMLPRGSKDPLIVLNRDIFFFTGALSKSISDAIPISVENERVALDYSEDGIRKRLRAHPHIVSNFADAITRIVSAGSSFGAIEVTLDDEHNHLHARLLAGMDVFIIAHENAHVILKHVSDKSVPFRLAGEVRQNGNTASRKRTSTPLMAQERTKHQELEADALGFKLMMWSLQTSDDLVGQIVAAAAPHMVFRIMDAVDAYGKEAGGWGFADANHPPASERIKALAPVFEELARTNQLLRQADFRATFDVALQVLLSEADSQIRKNLRLPAKPSSTKTERD